MRPTLFFVALAAAVSLPSSPARASQPITPVELKAAPYRAVPAFGGVKFPQPVQVVFAPGDTKRAFVVEREGVISVIRDLDHPKREVFLDLNQRGRASRRDHGPLSMVFHPKFAENGFVYVWFSTYAPNGQRSNRLARFHVSPSNPDVADLASELPMISQPSGPGGHDGGELLFGSDGYLYLSLGDGDEHLAEPTISHQRIDRSFFGAIIRIDVDKKPGSLPPNPHPAVHPGTYTVPPDNPFIGATSFNGRPVIPTSVRTEFWAVGLRNPWRMAFDPATGWLWCADVGLHLHEEIDLIVRGGNYGWDYREGVIAGPSASHMPADGKFIEPIWDYDHSTGISITGGFVYHGAAYPELEGKYLFGDYGFGKIWALEPDGSKAVNPSRVRQIATTPTIVAFTLDPRNGEVLIASLGEDQVFRLEPNKH
ncbi:MAG TPA: PQQ-dependent sugar dehydrogenase [Opitutaceae bacterium]|nr:PQQ-dependent sugar dehydrogenase [Opitutaceae bacterium]